MHAPKPKRPRDYAEQTYSSPYWIIRYPHSRRYALVVRAISAARPATLLDYGAGDGHILTELARSGSYLPDQVVAYEPIADVARATRAQFAVNGGSDRFVVVEALAALEGQSFEMILCLGVLEHMPLLERERFYHLCDALLTPGGRCLIDVPVETGLTLGVKEAGRVLLKGRRTQYSRNALLHAISHRVTFDPNRFSADNHDTWIQNHIGFDYRLFERELAARFVIVDRYGSPFPRLPPWLLNQEVFYLASQRDATLRNRAEPTSPV